MYNSRPIDQYTQKDIPVPFRSLHTPLEGGDDIHTGAFVYNGAHPISRIGRVRVRNCYAARLRDADITVYEDVVLVHSEAIFVGIEVRNNSTLRVGERILFHQNLSTHARMHTRGGIIDIAVTVDMAGSKPDRREA